jgi:FKBP-type peptidyl-prolyl cis-trans isomerase
MGKSGSMKKPLMALAISLATGLALAVSPAMAQSSSTGTAAKAPAQKTPVAQKPSSPTATPHDSLPAAPQPSSPFKDEKEKVSYALGLNIGTNLHRQMVEFDPNIFLQGLKDAMSGGKPLMTDEEVRATLTQFQTELRAKMEAKRQQEADKNKKDGEAFLAANKAKEGVVALPSGLQYKVLTPGTGPKPTSSDTVVCNYRGTLIDGTEFDSSAKHGEPASFPVSGVIKGWTEALQLMPVGSKWQLFVPSDLAYAERGAGGVIGPNATLVFEVELLSIKPKQETPAKP